MSKPQRKSPLRLVSVTVGPKTFGRISRRFFRPRPIRLLMGKLRAVLNEHYPGGKAERNKTLRRYDLTVGTPFHLTIDDLRELYRYIERLELKVGEQRSDDHRGPA
jgi:hypothetical protein